MQKKTIRSWATSLYAFDSKHDRKVVHVVRSCSRFSLAAVKCKSLTKSHFLTDIAHHARAKTTKHYAIISCGYSKSSLCKSLSELFIILNAVSCFSRLFSPYGCENTKLLTDTLNITWRQYRSNYPCPLTNYPRLRLLTLGNTTCPICRNIQARLNFGKYRCSWYENTKIRRLTVA